MAELTGTFEAIGSDGQQYKVNIFTEFVSASTFADPHAVVEGLKELRTSKGLHVNRIRKGEYQIVRTGVDLRSDSPNAP